MAAFADLSALFDAPRRRAGAALPLPPAPPVAPRYTPPAMTMHALLLACIVWLAGCTTPHVRTAPFRARPDSVVAGDLRGPFAGRVIDEDTGKPVTGALVYATWTVQSGYGTAQPHGFREHVTSTDAGGNYTVPALSDLPTGQSVRLSDFYLVVYKRGYVAYRSDRRFSDSGPRHDFTQKNHRILLKPWREGMSHAQHLRYIGGGPAIAALTAWEVEEAAAELAAASRPGRMGTDIVPDRGRPYLVAVQLLTPADVKAVTGFDGDLESGPLADEPDTAEYSSQHLKAVNRPETYDVALRIWRVDPGAAEERYRAMVDSLPGVEETGEIADRSLRASEGGIFGVGFLDARRGIVALLTCGQSQCDSAEVAVTLARGVFQRIEERWPKTGDKQ